MKYYAVMQQENEEPQVVSFEMGDERISELLRVVASHNLLEAVVPLAKGFTVQALSKLPQGGPTDGFFGAEDQDRLQQELDFADDEVLDLDLTTLILSTVHVQKDQMFVELVFSDTTWWSSAILYEEAQPWLKDESPN